MLNVPELFHPCQLALCHSLATLWLPLIPLLGQHLLPPYHTHLTNLRLLMICTPATLCLLQMLAILKVTTGMKSAPSRRFRRKIWSPTKIDRLTSLNRGGPRQGLTPMNPLVTLKRHLGRPTEAIGRSLFQSRLPFLLASLLPLPLSNLVREPGSKFPPQPSPRNNP